MTLQKPCRNQAAGNDFVNLSKNIEVSIFQSCLDCIKGNENV